MCIYIYIYIYIFVCIYIYRERERGREIDRERDMFIHNIITGFTPEGRVSSETLICPFTFPVK